MWLERYATVTYEDNIYKVEPTDLGWRFVDNELKTMLNRNILMFSDRYNFINFVKKCLLEGENLAKEMYIDNDYVYEVNDFDTCYYKS